VRFLPAAFPLADRKERHKAIEQKRRDRTKLLVQQLQSLLVCSISKKSWKHSTQSIGHLKHPVGPTHLLILRAVFRFQILPTVSNCQP
jgi:hypothetical protein